MVRGGSAYVFVRSGTFWTLQQQLISSARANQDINNWDQVGHSVSISGDYAILGAYGDDKGVGDSGAAYLFKYSGTTWTEQQKLKASEAKGAPRTSSRIHPSRLRLKDAEGPFILGSTRTKSRHLVGRCIGQVPYTSR